MDSPFERTPAEVLERYQSGVEPAPEASRGCAPKRTRLVWAVAYELPVRLARKHVTHTTAADVTQAKRDVLRHLPEGTRVITAEPTRSARRRARGAERASERADERTNERGAERRGAPESKKKARGAKSARRTQPT